MLVLVLVVVLAKNCQLLQLYTINYVHANPSEIMSETVTSGSFNLRFKAWYLVVLVPKTFLL